MCPPPTQYVNTYITCELLLTLIISRSQTIYFSFFYEFSDKVFVFYFTHNPNIVIIQKKGVSASILVTIVMMDREAQ